MRRTLTLAAVIMVATTVVSVVLSSHGAARTTYLTLWESKYPTSTIPDRMNVLTGSQCNTCHHPPTRSTPGTCYRDDMEALLDGGASITEALDILDTEDSDGDGVTNGEEILMGLYSYHTRERAELLYWFKANDTWRAASCYQNANIPHRAIHTQARLAREHLPPRDPLGSL